MKRGFFILSILAVLTVSCGRTDLSEHGTLPLVREIIQNTDNPFHKILASSTALNPSGNIYILGNEDAVMHLAEEFARCDTRDNIDGSLKFDGLPDFAGETICCCIDSTFSFSKLIEEARNGNDIPLRELTVKSVVGLIDTLCHVGPYDIEGMGRKQPAKMIILAAPNVALYAKADIDTLLAAMHCPVPVICPAEEMYDVVFSSRQGRDATMGALVDKNYEDSEVYTALFQKAASKSGSLASSFACFPNQTSNPDSTLVSFIDQYIGNGYTRPLNAIVIDTHDVKLEDMKSSLANLISVMNEDSMKYGKYFAKDFRFLHTSDAVTSRCYELLRTNNIFTHNIAKPQIEVYNTAVNPEDGKSIFLVPGTYVQN